MGSRHLDRTEELLKFYADRLNPEQLWDDELISKMAYLADWKSAVNFGHQITDFSWKLNHDVPAPDISEEELEALLDRVLSSRAQKPELDAFLYRLRTLVHKISGSDDQDQLNTSTSLNAMQKAVAESVVNLAKQIATFERMVEATYPVANHLLESNQSLEALAAEYNEQNEAYREVEELVGASEEPASSVQSESLAL